MKKTIMTAMAGILIALTSSAPVWAIDTTYLVNDNTNTSVSVGEQIQAYRATLQSRLNTFMFILNAYKTNTRNLSVSCNARLSAATTEEQKVAIRADCKAQAAVYRDNFHASVKALFRNSYDFWLVSLKARFSVFLSAIQSWPQDKKDELKVRITGRLDIAEEKANEKNDYRTLVLILAIRDFVAQI